jgi:hypothetical protein
LRATHPPYDALRQWVRQYVDLVGTKRGFAETLQSGDTAFAGLHDYVAERLEPVVADFLADAHAAKEIDVKLDPRDLLYAVALLCQPVPAAGFDFDYNRRMAMVSSKACATHRANNRFMPRPMPRRRSERPNKSCRTSAGTAHMPLICGGSSWDPT